MNSVAPVGPATPAVSVRSGGSLAPSLWCQNFSYKAKFRASERKLRPNLVKVSRPQQLICVGSVDEYVHKVAITVQDGARARHSASCCCPPPLAPPLIKAILQKNCFALLCVAG